MNGHSSTVGGWTDNRDLSDVISGRNEAIFPRWTVAFQASERNASQREFFLSYIVAVCSKMRSLVLMLLPPILTTCSHHERSSGVIG